MLQVAVPACLLSQLVELSPSGGLRVRFCRAADRHDRPDQGAEPQPGDPLPGIQALCHPDLLPQGRAPQCCRLLPSSLQGSAFPLPRGYKTLLLLRV